MKSSKEFNVSLNVAVLCVGDPGSGKTRLASAFPVPGILDCDDNMRSAVRVLGDKEFYIGQGFKDDAGKEVPVENRWVHSVKETKALLTHSSTQSFVLDGLSNLCRWGLVYAEAQLKLAGIDTRKEYLAKYQAFIPLLSDYITMLRIPGKMVVVNVHQIMEKDDLTGKIRYFLDIPGRLANTLGGQFTDVWGMDSVANPADLVHGAKYLIKTKPTGYHVNLKTSLDLEPSIDITGKTPQQIWEVLRPKLSINLPPKRPTLPVSTSTAVPTPNVKV